MSCFLFVGFVLVDLWVLVGLLGSGSVFTLFWTDGFESDAFYCLLLNICSLFSVSFLIVCF